MIDQIKEKIGELAGKYVMKRIETEKLDVDQTKTINDFMEHIMPMLFNEIEWNLDEWSDVERLAELESLKDVVLSDANIDKDDESVQRILAVVDDFTSELKQEVDYSETED